jgi:hypothetical protein
VIVYSKIHNQNHYNQIRLLTEGSYFNSTPSCLVLCATMHTVTPTPIPTPHTPPWSLSDFLYSTRDRPRRLVYYYPFLRALLCPSLISPFSPGKGRLVLLLPTRSYTHTNQTKENTFNLRAYARTFFWAVLQTRPPFFYLFVCYYAHKRFYISNTPSRASLCCFVCVY